MRAETRRWTAISAGGLAVLLGAVDTYVVVSIMTDIMKDVGIPINKIQRVTPVITLAASLAWILARTAGVATTCACGNNCLSTSAPK